jgi:nitrate reductase assembly molybdenum cofactor insertion protein NarJ
MEGRAHAAKQQFDIAVAGAWHAEAFARTKRLKPLSKYLAHDDSRGQDGAQMLAALREMNARGAPMTIRKVHG